MSAVQISNGPTCGSHPEPATRALLDTVSRYTNRLEDGVRPGHKLISAGLAPGEHDRAVLQARQTHLLGSLAPDNSAEGKEAMARVLSALLGAFPVYGIAEGQARATVQMICRALDDVPVWAVQRAAANFLKGNTKTPWNPDRAPTPPQIRSEAKLIMLDVEIELHRLEQVLNAEIVDSETTEDERRAAIAAWEQLKADMGRSNVIPERTDEEVERERSAMRRANDTIRRRDEDQRARLGLPEAGSLITPRAEVSA